MGLNVNLRRGKRKSTREGWGKNESKGDRSSLSDATPPAVAGKNTHCEYKIMV